MNTESATKPVVIDFGNLRRRRAFSNAAARAEKSENELFIQILESRVAKAEATMKGRFDVPAELLARAKTVADAEGVPIEEYIQKAVSLTQPTSPASSRRRSTERVSLVGERLIACTAVVRRDLIAEMRKLAYKNNILVRDFVKIAVLNKLSRMTGRGE